MSNRLLIVVDNFDYRGLQAVTEAVARKQLRFQRPFTHTWVIRDHQLTVQQWLDIVKKAVSDVGGKPMKILVTRNGQWAAYGPDYMMDFIAGGL